MTIYANNPLRHRGVGRDLVKSPQSRFFQPFQTPPSGGVTIERMAMLDMLMAG